MKSGLPSASAVVSALKGIHLPANADDLLEFAKKRGVAGETMMVLERLPKQTYESASDISRGISSANKQLRDMIPRVSAADVAKFVAGIDFPATKDQILAKARENKASEDVLHMFESMDRAEFRNVVDVARGISSAKDVIRKNAYSGPARNDR